AAPYWLKHGRCGHSFCAACILKWIFRAMDADGYWEDGSLLCPDCHVCLPSIPKTAPRAMCTFPLVRNHLAEATVKAYVSLLKHMATSQDNSLDRRITNGQWTAGLGGKVMPWGEGKSARTEWENRDHLGQTYMADLVERWCSMDSNNFRFMKVIVELRL
ncbi:hypothetical protein C8T65DRAFT_598434, partial [Cerioporus squamosus]